MCSHLFPRAPAALDLQIVSGTTDPTPRTVPGDFKAGVPKEIFTGLLFLPPHNYDLAADGRFLLVMTATRTAGPTPIQIILNWKSGLRP